MYWQSSVIRMVFILCALAAGWSAYAQLSPERTAMNSLEKGKYNRARAQLTKMLDKDTSNVMAYYLLSRYFFAPGNPDFSIDSAYRYCNIALSKLEFTSDRMRERLSRFSVDSTLLMGLRNKIDSAAFQRAKTVNTEEAYQYFIDYFIHASQRSQAIELRDEVAFLNALIENTYQSYWKFLDKYPQSHRANEARSRYDKLLFETKTSDHKLASYERFITEHPESPYLPAAERQIFEISTAVCTSEALLSFLNRFPKSICRKEATDLLYHILKETEAPFPLHLLSDSLRIVKELEAEHLVAYYKEGGFGWMNVQGKELTAPLANRLAEEHRCTYINHDVLLAGEKLISRNGMVIASGINDFEDMGYGFLLVEEKDCRMVLHKSGRRITGCVDDAVVLGGVLLAVKKDGAWQLTSFTGRVLLTGARDFMDAYPVLGIRHARYTELILFKEVLKLADGEAPAQRVVATEVNKLPFAIWIKNNNRQALLDFSLREQASADEEEQVTPVFFGVMLSGPSAYRLWDPAVPVILSADAVKIQEPWIGLRHKSNWLVYHQALYKPLPQAFDSLYFIGPALAAVKGDSLKVFITPEKWISLTGKPAVRFLPGKDSLYYLRVDMPGNRVIYDSYGQRLFATDAESISYAGENCFEAVKNNRKGLLSSSGKWLIPAEYDGIGVVRQGMVSVLRNNKFGMWNLSLRKEIKPEYERNITPLNENLLIAFRQGRAGLIGWDNKPVLPFEYDEIIPFTDTMLLVRKNFQWLLMDRVTKKIEPERIQSFSWISRATEEKLILFQSEGYYGVLSSRKGLVLQPTYTYIRNLGTDTEPFYLTEKHVEEAGIYVLIYYDANGRLVRRQVLEEEDYEQVQCSQ